MDDESQFHREVVRPKVTELLSLILPDYIWILHVWQ